MEPFELTIYEAADEISHGALSPVELTQSVLKRIDATEGAITAFTAVLTDLALHQAKKAEKEIFKSGPKSPFHGIPIAIKDNIDLDGFATTAGSRVVAYSTPTQDSDCVTALRNAGAVVVGKTQLHEFAYGIETPATRNPWNIKHMAGGSSGGSAAAVASKNCLMALGTDTAGSIRIPAAACGVVGLKPTYGLISTRGVIPLSWSLDHVGPLTRTVRDAALTLNALAVPRLDGSASPSERPADFTDGLEAPINGLTIGIPSNYFFEDINPDVHTAVMTALELLQSSGATLRAIEVPYSSEILATLRGVMMPEASNYHHHLLKVNPELYTKDVRARLESGGRILATHYIQAQKDRHRIRNGLRNIFGGLHVLAMPTLPITTPKTDQQTVLSPNGTERVVADAFLQHTGLASLTGFPAISIPCGFDSEGLPIGLQFIGLPFQERTLLQVARSYESMTEWSQFRPRGL